MEKSLNEIWPFHIVQPMHPEGKFAARFIFTSYTLPPPLPISFLR